MKKQADRWDWEVVLAVILSACFLVVLIYGFVYLPCPTPDQRRYLRFFSALFAALLFGILGKRFGYIIIKGPHAGFTIGAVGGIAIFILLVTVVDLFPEGQRDDPRCLPSPSPTPSPTPSPLAHLLLNENQPVEVHFKHTENDDAAYFSVPVQVSNNYSNDSRVCVIVEEGNEYYLQTCEPAKKDGIYNLEAWSGGGKGNLPVLGKAKKVWAMLSTSQSIDNFKALGKPVSSDGSELFPTAISDNRPSVILEDNQPETN